MLCCSQEVKKVLRSLFYHHPCSAQANQRVDMRTYADISCNADTLPWPSCQVESQAWESLLKQDSLRELNSFQVCVAPWLWAEKEARLSERKHLQFRLRELPKLRSRNEVKGIFWQSSSLRLHSFPAESPGSNPGWGTKILKPSGMAKKTQQNSLQSKNYKHQEANLLRVSICRNNI